MAGFAERLGHRHARSLVQSEDLDQETRIELWNVITRLRHQIDEAKYESNFDDDTEANLLADIWTSELHQPLDEIGQTDSTWGAIKHHILRAEWYDVLDLTEAIAKSLERHQTFWTSGLFSALTDSCNRSFERFLVGYRFIGLEVTPIDSTVEAQAVTEAQEAAAQLAGARHALNRAVELLADRQVPDYPNSMKESVSAVEAVVRTITGARTLGAGLQALEGSGVKLHPALKEAWSKMYGYTSDGSGIRHGGLEAAEVDQALAKYFLVTCSAFVSYLVEEGRQAGLL
ncbi:hypothetical protein SAMN04487788_1695 [Microbacterium testaceum StLB037]|uniref:HEPN AbiJ-N-terminal domain-containing protein n=1 Tax=Microbacterium testaceum (strain StLB037) TaxID=979556 RepID=A0A1H0P2F9_MICTS|nr:hypothetical protein [Microbacterium testaceum]SDO98918.1 hypothetical protein SAMN04487788_1695 [Microbacterium testaceum StLB037]